MALLMFVRKEKALEDIRKQGQLAVLFSLA
jgi:hypothetical protein